MPQTAGRRVRLSLPRRFMCDFMAISRGMPLVPAARRMQLAKLVQARQAASQRIGWCALFTKAYAIVAARTPEIRRSYFSFPYPHLYEHPFSIATISVSREYEGEEGVFFEHIRAPDTQELPKIDAHVRRCQTAPLESIGFFRRIITTMRLPAFARRIMWWYARNASGRVRVKYFGTFGLSVIAGQGASLATLISPCPTTLTYGPLAADGSIDVRLIFDHRVIDGVQAARALADLEEALTGVIVQELEQLNRNAA